MCSWAVHVRNFNVFERSFRPARSSPTQSFSFYRPPGRAQTSLENVKLRTCTAQDHINTPGKFRLFYFTIWCIIYCYSHFYKIIDSPPSPRRLGRLWFGLLASLPSLRTGAKLAEIGWNFAETQRKEYTRLEGSLFQFILCYSSKILVL